MKKLIFLISLLCLNFTEASSLRESCLKNSKIDQSVIPFNYQVTVDWSKTSDHVHVAIEDVLFGENFKVVSSTDIGHFTIFQIIEVSGNSPKVYELGLTELQRLTRGGVSCLISL